jgi:replication-associated recombination protein RarA
MSDLAVTMRPKTFDDMIGAESLTKKIQSIFKKGRDPNGWLFSGDTGGGKTTLARIMALSMQCRHQESFGNPCERCRYNRMNFNITELAMPDIGVKELRDRLDGFELHPTPGSRRRVYTLDEFHRTSGATQDLMLKYVEDAPRKTKFIFCTTDPSRVIPTLRSRCQCFTMPVLERTSIKELVRRVLKKCDSDRNIEDLVEALMEKNITSPRRIIRAAQKYGDTDSTAEDSAKVDAVTDVNTKRITRGVIKGSWEDVSRSLRDIAPGDIPIIKASVAGYLNQILLGDVDFGDRTTIVSKSILKLYEIRDEVPAVTAVLYQLCKYFSRYNR